LSYYNNVNAENALHKANNKFIRRFKKIEKHLNINLSENKILNLWEKTK